MTTNPLDFIWSIRGIAVCICHVAIGARMRSNVIDWTPEELWHAYVQLTEAEAAFRVHKSDLQIRPVWHHREHRVGAHILVCFLAYVLWTTEHQRILLPRLGMRLPLALEQTQM